MRQQARLPEAQRPRHVTRRVCDSDAVRDCTVGLGGNRAADGDAGLHRHQHLLILDSGGMVWETK